METEEPREGSMRSGSQKRPRAVAEDALAVRGRRADAAEDIAALGGDAPPRQLGGDRARHQLLEELDLVARDVRLRVRVADARVVGEEQVAPEGQQRRGAHD